MTTKQFVAVNPVLPVRNVATAVRYYTEKLGFRLLFQDNQERPTYAGIGRDGVTLHLQWHDEADFTGINQPAIRFVIADVDALFAEYQDKGIFHKQTALQNTPWGTREFAFYDGDGNGLFFYCDL